MKVSCIYCWYKCIMLTKSLLSKFQISKFVNHIIFVLFFEVLRTYHHIKIYAVCHTVILATLLVFWWLLSGNLVPNINLYLTLKIYNLLVYSVSINVLLQGEIMGVQIVKIYGYFCRKFCQKTWLIIEKHSTVYQIFSGIVVVV